MLQNKAIVHQVGDKNKLKRTLYDQVGDKNKFIRVRETSNVRFILSTFA
jgi:hypothetical protein